MAFWDWLTFNKKRIDYDIRQIVNIAAKNSFAPITRQRETADRWQKSFYLYDGLIKRDQFRTPEIMENLRLIRDLNPDSSMAIWNFLRLANSGHEVEAITLQGKVDQAATDLLKEVAGRVGRLYGGGLDQLINVLLLTAFTQGAIALEVELTEDLNDVVDFHAVDPSSLDFKRDQETGDIQLVQKQKNGEYKVLNQETVFYFPLDPEISDPYGRSPIMPVLQIVFFQIQVLKDLQKVVHHQGHKRFDIKVLEEAIIENMPEEIKFAGPEAVRDYVSDYISDIQEQMNNLEPDSDFFHTDSVEIGLAGGGVGSSGGLDLVRVIDIINQQIVTSLKQLPILLGRNEGSTETHGTIQWQIYVKGIESVQRAIKRLIERAYNVVLQINGLQRRSRITFDELRVTDRQSDATAEEIETRTKIQQVNQGWITNDEAALEMVGHQAVSDPAPVEINQAAARSSRKQIKREIQDRADTDEDEFVSEIEESWSGDIAKLTSRAKRSFLRDLKNQRDLYIERLENAGEIPSRVLVDIHSVRSFNREEKPDPPASFEYWVRANITNDYDQQLSFWRDEIREFMEDAAVITGAATLAELELDIEFNQRDERLLRWLQERSLREAQLIQGVSDEDVIMTLWDVVYEGQYTIAKAAAALEESYAFSPARAERIARTEIISAGRSGQYHADRQSGIVIGKQWKAALQERTRKGHREADGQIVELDEPFYVANGKGQIEALLFPGDTSYGASASNVIQCRCWYKRILQGESLE